MKRHIVLNFADDPSGPLRLKMGDILLIARKDDGVLKIEKELEYLYNNSQGMPVIVPALYDSLDEYIQGALNEGTLSMEILAHSSYKSAHHLSSTVTKNCPKQSFTLDELVALIESDILKKNISKISISLIICQAGGETAEFPSIAGQLFALFTEKPLKITARKGFVYMENREKIFSLGSFDTLLHKAYISANTSVDTYLEYFSYPVLRGLKTLLSATQLHAYDNSTPLNEKFVYFNNEQNKTIKIDKHLYDLYHLSYPKPEMKLEQCTKEDFIKLARAGMQSNKNEKLYKKSEIILKEIDLIQPAIILQIELRNYQKRDQLFRQMELLHQTISTTPLFHHAKKLKVLLNIIGAYINSRYFFNLPFDSIESLLNVLNKVIAQNGQFNKIDFQNIEAINQYIKSDSSARFDACEYIRLADPLWPNDAIEAITYCKQINKQFSGFLEIFSQIITTENRLAENKKVYIIKLDEQGNSAPEINRDEIKVAMERLHQLIHQQIKEASYSFSCNKLTSFQVEILTFLLKLIRVRQKQESKNNELDFFIPLWVQGIKNIISQEPKHARLQIIEQAIDDFVKKYYTISKNYPSVAPKQHVSNRAKLEFFDHNKPIKPAEPTDTFDNRLFDLD